MIPHLTSLPRLQIRILMKRVLVKVTDNKDPKRPKVHKLYIDESGFIYVSHERVMFSTNILDLKVNEDTLKVYMSEKDMVIQSVPYYMNYLYQRVLNQLPLLFKPFHNAYEEIDIRDQMSFKDKLYIVKFTNFNGIFRLNNVMLIRLKIIWRRRTLRFSITAGYTVEQEAHGT